MHSVRIAMVVALGWLLPRPHQPPTHPATSPPPLAVVQSRFPQANALVAAGQSWEILDTADRSIGSVMRTRPAADRFSGYRGPTEALLWLDDQTIEAVTILESHDTPEHVAAVATSQRFLDQFVGRKLNQTFSSAIDGVSGATLTAMAMAGGIVESIQSIDNGSAEPTSLLFKDHPVLKRLENNDPAEARYELSTGAFADDVVGYQGPTEVILQVDDRGEVTGGRLGKSYDNEPYVTYVAEDRYFWDVWIGRNLSDLDDESVARVEGVSGATMTSLAVVDSLVKTAGVIENLGGIEAADQAFHPPPLKPSGWLDSVRIGAKDGLTIAALAGVLLIPKPWWRRRWIRRSWLVIMFSGLGLYCGHLISLALLFGWAAEPVTWSLAIGLMMLLLVAIVSPASTGTNAYCNHLCPHGAIQQLVRPKPGSRLHAHPPKRLSRWVSYVPGLTLTIAYLTILFSPTTDLSRWEPFYGYLWQYAPAVSIGFAVGTIWLASRVPMAYCRWGCPTGSLLGYLRRSAASPRWGNGDWVAVSLLAIAIFQTSRLQ